MIDYEHLADLIEDSNMEIGEIAKRAGVSRSMVSKLANVQIDNTYTLTIESVVEALGYDLAIVPRRTGVEDFSEWLGMERTARGLSQPALGRLCDVALQTIQSIEGGNKPSWKTVLKLLHGLGYRLEVVKDDGQ